eukprot:COSAG05_NODE_1123_length_5793_cov_4.158588_2_plen_56_part_00
MPQRIGQKTIEEPAEEIRLHLVSMLRAFVTQPALDKVRSLSISLFRARPVSSHLS